MQQQVAISKNPKVEQLVRGADGCIARGDYKGAVRKLSEAVEIEPRNAELLRIAARWEESQHNYETAERYLRTAIRLRPKMWILHADLGSFLIRTHRLPEAVKSFRQAHLSGSPTSAPLVQIARLMEHSRDQQQADEALGIALARWPNDPNTRVQHAVVLVRQGDIEQGERKLCEVISEAGVPHEIRSTAYHELGALLDKQGRTDEAWEAFTLGKQAYTTTLPPRPYSMIPKAEANLRGLTQDLVQRWTSHGNDDGETRFALLAGFPRSGTTLLEVILGSHSRVLTLEETHYLDTLNRWVYEAVGPDGGSIPLYLEIEGPALRAHMQERYRKSVAGILGKDLPGGVVLDKHPMSTPLAPFFLWMLPRSRIIMPLRDPRDVVVSNYMQQMLHPDLSSLDAIVDLYHCVMSGWLTIREWLGDAAIEVRYEDTVTDLERESRRILDHLGLEWDPALLSFHERARTAYVGTPSYEAVTQPVNTRAIGRWRRYEAHLASVMDRLLPMVDTLGYER
ncbi:MAG: sulfotransferase family protein [Phycisphaeraceae bacterium]|nr:MAG: sulfotransferase family protein [Phycisphaeraceae bacterium]